MSARIGSWRSNSSSGPTRSWRNWRRKSLAGDQPLRHEQSSTRLVSDCRGGLRIGKKLPERSAGEPFDEQLEWDRDGQYFHYLTKWMHALDQVARSTKQPRFNLWARAGPGSLQGV